MAHVIFRLDYGGLENSLVNLINHMPSTGYRHAIVCLAGFSDFRSRIRKHDVSVFSLDKQPGKDPGAYLRMWRLLRSLKPAIVHTRNLGTIDMQWVARLAGVPGRVHGEHGWEAADATGQSRRARVIRRACRYAIQHYLAVSKDLAVRIAAWTGASPARISQVYNGVDTDRFQRSGPVPADLPWSRGPGAPVVFGTVARLDPVKNHVLLLRAFASLRRSVAPGVTVRLVIAGDGPLRETLVAEVARLGLEESVWMPGTRDDVPDLMRSFDVFVLPSVNEGISNTILEAMASGLPVVAGRVGGNPELVLEGETGLLVDRADPEGWARALGRYAADPDLRVRHGASARARAQSHFSLEAMVDGYQRVYASVLAA